MSDCPSFNLPEILRRRDRLYQTVIVPRLGQVIDGDGLDQLSRALCRTLPNGVTKDAIFESVRHIAGQPLTGKSGLELAWRLSGNLPRLRAGQAVTPWAVQRGNEWVPVQVTRCFPARDHRDRIGDQFSFRVLAGTPCPMLIRAFWRQKVVRYVAARVGFSRPWGDYPFQKSVQLVGLRFLAHIDAARSRTFPEFHEIECPQSLITWNRNNVLRLRLRVHGEKCPNGWRHECHRCAVGYQECLAATHRFTYESGSCTQCGKDYVPFDPEDDSVYCINCTTTNLLRKQE